MITHPGATIRALLQMPMAGLFMLVGATGMAAPDPEPLVADRPGFSSAPAVVGTGVAQVELGYEFSRGPGGDVDDHTVPVTLARVGVSERVELQLGWSGYTWQDGDENDSGALDASAGIKWRITDADAATSVALFAGTTLPVGDDDFSSDDADPSVGVFWSHSGALDWFGTVLVSDSSDGTGVGAALGLNLPIDDVTGAYVEYFAQYVEDIDTQHYLNGGFTRLFGPDLQLDAYLGAGFDDDATDLFVGMGASYRF